MKKGVLIVSFGTSYREAEAQNINPVEQAISGGTAGAMRCGGHTAAAGS